MIDNVDVVVGLAWGDEGKGKITSSIASKNDYNYVCRWAGGSNAGHTVYVDGKKYATHIIPSGVFKGVPSVIGPGCVVNKDKLYQELEYLHTHGFNIDLVKVSPRAHMVTDDHIAFDKINLSSSLGTTSNGIAPCYADKAARTGLQAFEVLPEKLIWDEELSGNILCEGAQGVWLDLDWGNYPFVTSSTTLPYGACSLGIPPQKIRRIYGVAKIYDTRSGVDPFFPENLLSNYTLSRLGQLGREIGVTTGRKRKVNWLDLNKLIKAINITGTTDLIINKCDIISQLDIYKLYYKNELKTFQTFDEMKLYVESEIGRTCPMINSQVYSYSPEFI